MRFNLQRSAQQTRSFLHASKAKPGMRERGVAQGWWGEAAPIVADDQAHLLRLSNQFEVNTAGLRVANYVGQALLGNAKEGGLYLDGQAVLKTICWGGNRWGPGTTTCNGYMEGDA
jgi:hypothetical protein